MRRRLIVSMLLAAGSAACVRWSPPAMAPTASGSCRSPSLRWISPADAGERKRLDSWCKGVGDVVIRRARVSADPPALDNIVFVSWNVHVGNGDLKSFVRDLRAGRHTNNRKVEHFVLLLQEAVRTGVVPPFDEGASGAAHIPAATEGAGDILQLSQDLGLSLIYVPSMRNGRSPNDPAADRGNAILSTSELSSPVAVELPGERQRRVLVFAKLADLTVGVVHLDALGSARRWWLFWTPWMRKVQVRSIEGLLRDGPFVLGADLNTWHGRDEPAARLLKELGPPTPVSIELHGLGLRVLDYLVFRTGQGRAQYRQLSERYGSDHRPLVGWLE